MNTLSKNTLIKNTVINATPSHEGRELLETLKQSVAKALERKRRLGQYAVTWQDGRPVVMGDDAPGQIEEPPRS